MWKVGSPKGKTEIKIWQQEDGSLKYGVEKYGRCLIQESILGLSTDLGELVSGLVFRKEERCSVSEEYSIPAGKKEIYQNEAEELVLSFRKGEVELTVRFRAFDDGAAFRYEVTHPNQAEIKVKAEATEFHLSDTFETFWLQDWVPTYEGPYLSRKWDKSIQEQPFGMPSLFFAEKDQVWLMINEANLLNTNGSFCSCNLVGDENRCMTIGFAPEEKGRPISTPLPFRSAWRYLVLADNLDELVNSTINYNLNPPSLIEDTSWIRPGRTLWAWWEDMNGAQRYIESKNYVDLAAAYGFEGVTLDCGWDASWVKRLCEYAHKKGIQIWIWTPMQKLDTREKAEKWIPLWAGWGVDGLKIDFFENDSQHTMWQYQMMADLMREYKLMINFHGSVKPMGEGRTWPHFMTAEGIMGLEHYQWSNMPNAVHNCTVPFTRNVAGPMDYTPTGFTNRTNKNTTMGHQMAMPVVFDSGMTHYALALRFIEGWKGTDFLRRSKNHYKGVKVLSGYPGDHAAILRYTDDEWLIGAITSPKKVLHLPLDFLGEGTYEAEIYEDSNKGEMIQMTKRIVTAEDTLKLSLLENGGAGVYITRKIKPLSDGICSGYLSDCYTEYSGREAKLFGGSEYVQWNQEISGFTLNGSAELTGYAEETKDYTFRFFYAAEEEWTLEYTCCSVTGNIVMPTSTGIRTFVTQDVIIHLEAGDFILRLKKADGKAPSVWKVKKIDNNPVRPLVYPVKKEYLSGGGEVVTEIGEAAAVGLGGEAKLIFDEVTVPKGGTYVLRIWYVGGNDRDVSVKINGKTVIVDSDLHNTSGWEFPAWDTLGDKELLVELENGRNTIELFSDRAMSHIHSIELIEDQI